MLFWNWDLKFVNNTFVNKSINMRVIKFLLPLTDMLLPEWINRLLERMATLF